MVLLKPTTLKEFCIRAGVRPDKSSGQHFLINQRTLERIVAAVDPRATDTILEVGAGFGVLTTALAPRVARVIAIERDRRITPILRELVSPYGNVEVVEGNVLRFFEKSKRGRPTSVAVVPITGEHWKLAANLPYGITSDFFRLLFDRVADGSLPPPKRAVLLLQREVVDRLVADPKRPGGRSAVGFLTILTRLHCSPRRIIRVPPTHFWPSPKVESAVVALDGWRSPTQLSELLGGVTRDQFLRLVHACFTRRRAQLKASLKLQARLVGTRSVSCGAASLLRWDAKRLLRGCKPTDGDAVLRAAGVDPTARPETLTLAQWISLANALRS